MRYWTPKDIFEVKCFNCGKEIEFWKDEPMRVCSGCSREVRNPRIDLGCAKWCKFAKECLGKSGEDVRPVAPVIDRLELLLDYHFAAQPHAVKRARKFHRISESLLTSEKGDPCVIQAAALLAGAFMDYGADAADSRSDCEAMLQKAGIDVTVAGKIFTIAADVLAGRNVSAEEGVIIADILTLERIAQARQSGISTESFAAALKTQGAKKLAAQQF